MSAPLSSPQKCAGTCTTPTFDAEPASPLFEPHAAVTTAAAATAAHVLPWPPRGRRCGAADMWDSFRDFLWSAIVVFAFIAYLLILFHIIVDLFWRDHQTPGWVKAMW